jgi:hypothetical protein
MVDEAPNGVRDVLRVIVTQRVIDKIVRGALLYPEPETGEAMIGLVVPRAGRSEPDIYILDTISPGEHTVREWGMFEQGDDWQGDVFHWLHINWEAFRELRRGSYGKALAAKWDTPLMHVGDWHKQPGDMIAPSSGDAQTARHMIADAETPMEQLVAPIVTVYPLHPAKQADLATVEPEPAEAAPDEATTVTPEAATEEEVSVPPPSSQAILIPREDVGWLIRIDFWYMSKRNKKFVSVTPEIWADDRLPSLPPVAWHLAHPKRFDQEYGLLAQAGYVVDVVRWDADGMPPYEICFSVYKPGSSQVILLVTSVDYPTQMPAVRIAPMVSAAEDEDLFEKQYEASQPVLMTQMPDWLWDSKRTLLELVWHIEKVLKKEVINP